MQYIGGKTKFSKAIIQAIKPELFPSYIEPFAGGMNVISEVINSNRIAADTNRYLIALWNELISGYIPQRFTRTEYTHIRTNPELYEEHIVGDCGFLSSFKGKWFGGYNGDSSNGRDYQGEMIRNVLRQVEKMRGVTILLQDYRDLKIPDGSLVYCDPPYKNTQGYQPGKFNHDEFWDWCRLLSSRATVYVSEFEAPSDFKEILQFNRKNHMNFGKTETVTERLFLC